MVAGGTRRASGLIVAALAMAAVIGGGVPTMAQDLSFGTPVEPQQGAQSGASGGLSTGSPAAPPAGSSAGSSAGSPLGTVVGTPTVTQPGAPAGMSTGTPLGAPMAAPAGESAGTPTGARAGAAIKPVIEVNAGVVTSYELDQRIRLMTLLNQQGDVPKLARESLIDDRLRNAAAKALGVDIPDAAVTEGMNAFAARGQLSLDQLTQLMNRNGIDQSALRDFVRSGMEWRAAVQAKYGGNVNVSDAEIDRAIGAGVAAGGELQVLLSEIFLPSGTGAAAPGLLARRILDGASTLNAFQVYAQEYSKAPSANSGGRLNWQPVSALPPEVARAVSTLKPGQMTGPLAVNGGLAIYYLRDESQGPGTTPPVYDVDFAQLVFADAAEARSVAAVVTRCEDLYPVARGLPEEALARQTRPERGLPADLARLFAGMDPGETVTRPAAGGGTELVMLCNRVPESKVPPSRDAVRTALLNRKLALLAQGWLQQMRADAIIRDR